MPNRAQEKNKREREKRKLERNPRKKEEREMSSKCYQSLTDQ